MSIIHDALKKVQSKKQNAIILEEIVLQPGEPLPAEPPQKTPKKKNFLAIILLGLVCIVVSAMFFLLFRLIIATNPAPKLISNEIKQKISDKTKTVAQMLPAPHDEPGIKVEGVMQMENKILALIDGDVFEEGQQVRQKTISKITLDSVTLTDIKTGATEILPVKHK